jgi:hypothetical protein
MFKTGRIIFLLSLFLIVFQMSCKRGNEILSNDENSEVPSEGKWEFIGLEGKSALRLVLAEPYLYVCAGPDGLWRRDIRKMTPWEYLGWADTSLSYGGVQDVDVKGNDILLAYNPVHVSPWVSAGIWRSKDGGKTWFRSDIGIPDSSWPYSSYLNVQRSPDNPNIAITSFGGAIFRSTDGGTNWKLVFGRRGGLANKDFVKWQFNKKGLVWFYGESSVSAPYLFRSTDYGNTFGGSVNFYAFGFYPPGAVLDVAFDANNPNIVYAVANYGVFKTTDGGYTWNKIVPGDKLISCIAEHPSIGGLLYLAGDKRIYITYDGGTTLQLIGELECDFITSLAVDIKGNRLFLGTTRSGVYALKLNGLKISN